MIRELIKADKQRARWWQRRWPVRAVIAAILTLAASEIVPARTWNHSSSSTELLFAILVGAYILSRAVQRLLNPSTRPTHRPKQQPPTILTGPPTEDPAVTTPPAPELRDPRQSTC